ncbi:MAG: M56 family metallopeptidase [Acidobacteriota bacterium]
MELVVRTTLILGAGWASALLLRRATPATRHLVSTSPSSPSSWRHGLAWCFLDPRATSGVEPGRRPDRRAPGHYGPLDSAGLRASRAPGAALPGPQVAGLRAESLAPRVGRWQWMAAWFLGAVAVSLRFACGWIAAALLRRRAGPAPVAWQVEVTALAERMRIGWPVTLRLCPPGLSPMIVGIWRPAVLLPASASQWSATRRRAVLLHELALVARRDPGVLALAQAACALYWTAMQPGT